MITSRCTLPLCPADVGRYGAKRHPRCRRALARKWRPCLQPPLPAVTRRRGIAGGGSDGGVGLPAQPPLPCLVGGPLWIQVAAVVGGAGRAQRDIECMAAAGGAGEGPGALSAAICALCQLRWRTPWTCAWGVLGVAGACLMHMWVCGLQVHFGSTRLQCSTCSDMYSALRFMDSGGITFWNYDDQSRGCDAPLCCSYRF